VNQSPGAAIGIVFSGIEVAPFSLSSYMVNIWIVAAGALALAATAIGLRLLKRGDAASHSVQGVSEEWLSNARSQRDESW
jgi:hypothetical protein